MMSCPRLFACVFDCHNIPWFLDSVSGGELFERVVADDFMLTEHECVLFMQQICSGVQYMHDNNIMHLDMKARTGRTATDVRLQQMCRWGVILELRFCRYCCSGLIYLKLIVQDSRYSGLSASLV